MYIKLIFKQTINNKQMNILLDCTNTEILMYSTYSTHLRFGISYTHSFGTDTHTWCFRPLSNSNQLPIMIDKLNPLVGSVVRHTIIDYHVEPIPLGAHVDQKGYRVSNMYRAGYSGTCVVHSVHIR